MYVHWDILINYELLRYLRQCLAQMSVIVSMTILNTFLRVNVLTEKFLQKTLQNNLDAHPNLRIYHISVNLDV